MIIVDTALRKRAEAGNPIRVALVGAGFMGRGFVNQVVNSVPGMELVAICNRTAANAERAFTEAGVTEWETVTDAAALDAAVGRGVPAITTCAPNSTCPVASTIASIDADSQTAW